MRHDEVHATKCEEAELLRFLRNPHTYDDSTEQVEERETHISRVFLTRRFAYKLKKGVRFDFLDFSTAELRRKCCENEVRRNSRLAPGVYLGTVPVVRLPAGRLCLGNEVRWNSSATPVEWLVKMRRLADSDSLESLIRAGAATPEKIEELAQTLAAFYIQSPPVTLTVDEYRGRIERHVEANLHELHANHPAFPMTAESAAQIKRITSRQLAALRLAPESFDERVRNGRIVEGHGDLRPEHIFFTPSPRIIDCIEFNREYCTIDVLDELAFLSMECERLGAADLIAPVLDEYRRQSGDDAPETLVDFYRLYRACVRAKVCLLRSDQSARAPSESSGAVARSYLDLADRYARRVGPNVLTIVRGLSGTGKSTIAESLAERLSFELLQSDAIRRELFDAKESSGVFNEGVYAPECREQVYDQLLARAKRLLQLGCSVTIDATFLSAARRREAAELAHAHGAGFLVIRCACDEATSRQRISERRGDPLRLSDAQPEFVAKQRAADEADAGDWPTVTVDTSGDADSSLGAILAALRPLCLASDL